MAKLITEMSYDFEVSESNSGSMYIVGIFSSADVQNHNKRRYKKELLEREITKLNESKITKKCCFGELSHPACIPGDSEILTIKGWKKISEIDDNEVVATLNTKSKNIEYNKINKKIDEHYNGKMLHLKNRQIDMMFTPNHRHLLVDRYDNYSFSNSNEIFENKKNYDKHYIPKIGKWEGEEIETFVFKGVDTPFSKQIRNWKEDLSMDMSLFIPLLGLYLSEGCLLKKKKENVGISITQIKEENRLLIEKLFEKMPEDVHWYMDKKSFVIYDLRIAEYFSQFGICYDKFIPEEVKNLDEKYLQELLYWFGFGDGRHYISKDGFEKRDIFSTSEKLIDDFSEIAFKCGVSTKKGVEISTEPYVFANRIIKPENKKPLYFLKLQTTKGVYLDKRFMTKEMVDYNNRVYCVNVKNNNFYVRNEKSVAFWTGNSPDINLDKVAILTTELDWKGNDVYGKAKVLDTPNGNIAKELIKEGRLGISSRGLGTVSEDGFVNEDFNLLTYDLVSEPGNPSSWVNGIFEGREFEICKEPTMEEAIEYHKRQVWQVIENIEKSL